MSQTGTSAWWADVQHLRDASERTDEARRRADRAELAARRASRDRRRVDAEVAPAPAAPRRRVDAEVAPRPAAPRRRVDAEVAPRPAAPRRRVDAEVAPAPAAPRRRLDAEVAPRSAPKPTPAPPRRRVEPDMPPPRRRDHIDPVPRVGYGDAALPGRRTVEIRGRTVPAPAVPRTLDVDRRRPPRRAVERVGPRPDRLALWALVMGLVLILVAVTTADAATVAVVTAL
jgi:hypothetical protein